MPASAPPASPPPAANARGARPWDRFRQTLVQYDRSKVNAARGFRNALGVAVPLIVGAFLGRIGPALVMATGALNVGFADSPDPEIPRARRMAAASILVTLAVFCGSLSGWTLPSALVVAATWSFLAGMLVSLGVQIGNMGVTSTCVLFIFASRPLSVHDAFLAGLLALGGGFFQTLLSIIPWPGRPYGPERSALSSLYRGLAQFCSTPITPDESPPATASANDAREALASRQGDHSVATERYRALLDQAERARATLLTLRTLRARLDAPDHPANPEHPADSNKHPSPATLLDDYLHAARRALEAAGEMLWTGESWPGGQQAPPAAAGRILEEFRALAPAFGRPALMADIRVQMDSLTRQLRVTFDLAGHATPAGSVAFARDEARRPWRMRVWGDLGNLLPNFNLRSTAIRHAIRLSVCVTAADALGRCLGWNRPYWLPLTVTVVLKPDFSSTFSRGVLRLAGTFAGLTFATILFHLLPQKIWVEIVLIMAATFILRWTGPAHYGVLAMSVSELVVLLVALAGVQPAQVIMARATNTALGGAMALLAYWFWPTWERTQVAETFAHMLDAYREHLALITRAFSDSHPSLPAALDRTRSASRLARTNLEASVDRLSAEPASTPEERDRWQSMLASSHIFAHAVIALHASLLADPDALRSLGQNPAFQTFIQQISLTLENLSAILRGADPASLQFPDLRLGHYNLIHSGEPMAAPHTLISVETDKMVNSLNTLREQIQQAASARRTRGATTR